MIASAIDNIRQIAKEVCPWAAFECDVARMLNVKVEKLPRFLQNSDGETILDNEGAPVSTSFIYVEEPTSGSFSFPVGRFPTQDLALTMYFCKFEPEDNNGYDADLTSPSPAATRIQLRDEIEETMVRPFLKAFIGSSYAKDQGTVLENVTVSYPSARFDANEVSVCVEFRLSNLWCMGRIPQSRCIY